MEEKLDKLIDEIKKDERYIEYIEASKNLTKPNVMALLKEYQEALGKLNELSKYEPYISNQEIKDEIKVIKKEMSENEDIVLYYQKYHQLNDFLSDITGIVFNNISNLLDLSPYHL